MGESATIPCEFCDQPIDSVDYERHAGECRTAQGAITIPISFYINGQDDIGDYESASDGECDEDLELLQRYITSNRQIANGANLRAFLEDHFASSSTRGSSPSSMTHQNLLMLRVPTNTREGARLTSYEFFSGLSGVDVGVNDIDSVSSLIDYEQVKEENCPICQQSFKECWEENLGVLFRQLKCNHTYCDECITTWLNKHKNCPVCKHVLE